MNFTFPSITAAASTKTINHLYNNKINIIQSANEIKWIQLWRRSCDVNRPKRLYGSQRMPGLAVYEWCIVHQFGTEIPLSMRLFGRILGRKLSISARGTNIEIEHGSSGSHSCLPIDYIKWAISRKNLQSIKASPLSSSSSSLLL